MSNFGSYVKALRKASTHLTEEAIFRQNDTLRQNDITTKGRQGNRETSMAFSNTCGGRYGDRGGREKGHEINKRATH